MIVYLLHGSILHYGKGMKNPRLVRPTSPIMILPVLSPLAFLVSCVPRSLHSSCTTDSATRGGFTSFDATGVRPASSSSSTPRS